MLGKKIITTVSYYGTMQCYYLNSKKIYKNNKSVLLKLEGVLDVLSKGEKLPLKNLNHRLKGEFKDWQDQYMVIIQKQRKVEKK